MMEQLNFTAGTRTADLILKGRYDSSDLDTLTQYLIEYMQISHPGKPISAELMEEEFTSKLKVWKESTTTSPSGLHLGHWKALIAQHLYSRLDNKKAETSTQFKVQYIMPESNSLIIVQNGDTH
jgi:hypothetical protein